MLPVPIVDLLAPWDNLRELLFQLPHAKRELELIVPSTAEPGALLLHASLGLICPATH